MKSNFACAVIWRLSPEDGEIEFLVVDSQSTNPKTGRMSERQIKFPGGMNRLPDEPLNVHVQREVLEETYLAFSRAREIWKKEVNKVHTKYGFMVNFEDCRGTLRTEVLIDNNDVIGPPYWALAVTLGPDLFGGHQDVYMKACCELGITW